VANVQIRRALAAGAVAAATLVPVGARSGVAGAEPAGDSERIGRLQDQIGEASRDEADAMSRLAVVQGRRAALEAKVAALDEQVRGTQARIAESERAASLLTVAALELDRRADVTAKRLRVAKHNFEYTAASLYTGNTGPAVAYTSLLVEAGSVTEVGTGRAYLEHVGAERERIVHRLDGLRVRTARLRLKAEQQRTAVAEVRRRAIADQSTLRGLRAQQAVQRDAVSRQETRVEAVVASIRSRKSEYTAELAALQQTSVQIRALLYDIQSSEPRASSFSAQRPVPGYITSGFGYRYHPVLGYGRMHTGVDFHADYGEPIHAAAAGRVVWSGPRGGYGNCVVIDHGGQFATLYGHASELYANVGDHVDAGATIAAVGSTGLATGPHLHFEVRILGNPVDPMSYL
jgi:murein DD-endopeptidase MepM/ murein hydrolase activator NlpD